MKCSPGCTCGRHLRPVQPVTYRQLQPGEKVPSGEPKRYTSDSRGYVRLRWKVGISEYVETYEHRLVAGLPAADVHHGNDVKDDNDPANLHPLSRADHSRLHAPALIAARRARPPRFGTRVQIRAAKAARVNIRRKHRDRLRARCRELRASGLTYVQIGELVGRHHTNVSHLLNGQ